MVRDTQTINQEHMFSGKFFLANVSVDNTISEWLEEKIGW
jgi:hypothetical protein